MKLFFLFLFLNSLNSFSQSVFRTEIKFIGYEDKSNNIYIEVTGYGSTNLIGQRDAMENLFNAVFFRGIPGSSSIKPLISINESEAWSKYANYLNSFLDKKRYLTFVNEKKCSDLNGKGKRRKLVCTMSINIQALKDDLRFNKIISDYGF